MGHPKEPDRAIRIGGSYTDADWKELRSHLLKEAASADMWSQAVNIFRARIESRFLAPIRRVLSRGELEGEGFAAAALQAVLVEFLEAFYEGVLYCPPMREGDIPRKAAALGIPAERLEKHQQPHEYSSSSELFRRFLTEREPFRKEFSNKTARVYYENIRCGLLHEAATKRKTLIRSASAGRLIESVGKDIILYRTTFQAAIEGYVNQYCKELPYDRVRQKAFIRKMDDLCQIRRTQYFAYGRNLNRKCLNSRKVTHVHDWSTGQLHGYRFVYNKMSSDGSAKGNIQRENGASVWGVCYELDEEDYRRLVKTERGYNQVEVFVEREGAGPVICRTFVSGSLTHAAPLAEYIREVVQGAQESQLPDAYITEFLEASTGPSGVS